MGLFVWFGGVAAPGIDFPSQAPIVIPVQHSVLLTGYNALPEQSDDDPDITASGAFSNPQIIVARSRDLAEELPFGTIVSFEAPETVPHSCGFYEVEHLIGYRVVADVLHKRKIQQLDILFDQTDRVYLKDKAINPALAIGLCDVTIRVVGKVAMKDIPKSQAELAMLVSPLIAHR